MTRSQLPPALIVSLLCSGLLLGTLLLNSGCASEDTVYQPATSQLVKLADGYAKSGQTEKALCRLEAASELNPDIFQIHYNLGIMHYQESNWPQAIEHLNQALTLQENQPDSLYTLMLAWAEQGDQFYRVAKTEQKEDLEAMELPEAIIHTPPEQAKALAIEHYQQALQLSDQFLQHAPESDPGRQDAQALQQQLAQRIEDLSQESAS